MLTGVRLRCSRPSCPQRGRVAPPGFPLAHCFDSVSSSLESSLVHTHLAVTWDNYWGGWAASHLCQLAGFGTEVRIASRMMSMTTCVRLPRGQKLLRTRGVGASASPLLSAAPPPGPWKPRTPGPPRPPVCAPARVVPSCLLIPLDNLKVIAARLRRIGGSYFRL